MYVAIIAAPTYAGRVAPTALERIKRLQATGTPAILAVLYGNRDYEDALLELRDCAITQGFLPVAGGAFIGEHSYSTTGMPTAAGRPDESDIQIARNFGKEIMRKLEKLDESEDIASL